MQFLKHFGNELIMIVLVLYSFEYVHSVALCLAVVLGIVVNVVKFYWLVVDRRKYHRWKNPSYYWPKKKK